MRTKTSARKLGIDSPALQRRRRKMLPYKITLPKDAISPTNSIYKTFDIVNQQACLESYPGSRTHYSAKPFTLRFLTKGKIVTKASRETIQKENS